VGGVTVRSRHAVRALVGVVAAVLVAGAAGWVPAQAALALGLIATLVAAGETLIASRRPSGPQAKQPAKRSREAVVDTSALIDGRLPEIVESGFLYLDLVVPEFVLRELQHVADAPDAARRARGRRGLDTLQRLKASPRMTVHIVGDDVMEERVVDLKLVALARRRGAALVTTDFNLNKVAGIRELTVLNVNDLAHALRPVVLPGERLRVTIVKEGREPGQGVAYLEDGTMIVVEQGRALNGRTIDVVVTSAIQTAAGKMFFAKPAEG
jgi:uncharacterized protein YacL